MKDLNNVFFLLGIYTFMYLEIAHHVKNPDSTFYSFIFVHLLCPLGSGFTFLK